MKYEIIDYGGWRAVYDTSIPQTVAWPPPMWTPRTEVADAHAKAMNEMIEATAKAEAEAHMVGWSVTDIDA
jgi:hypothetical protein